VARRYPCALTARFKGLAVLPALILSASLTPPAASASQAADVAIASPSLRRRRRGTVLAGSVSVCNRFATPGTQDAGQIRTQRQYADEAARTKPKPT
jgi:hypothetical protein